MLNSTRYTAVKDKLLLINFPNISY